jgi:hypothetical protein
MQVEAALCSEYRHSYAGEALRAEAALHTETAQMWCCLWRQYFRQK